MGVYVTDLEAINLPSHRDAGKRLTSAFVTFSIRPVLNFLPGCSEVIIVPASPRIFLASNLLLLCSPLAIFLQFFFSAFHFAVISAQLLDTMGVMDSLLSTLAPLTTAAPYHLLAYGTLLGTELYQVCKNIAVYSSKN